MILDIWLEAPTTGLAVLDLLNQDPTTRRIPVIVCSAHITELRRQEERLRQQGYAVVEKPFEVNVLLATVRTMLA